MINLNPQFARAAVAVLLFCFGSPAAYDSLRAESPDPIHEKMRTKPYPREELKPYINPAPLLVPNNMKTAEFLQFELSKDASFPDNSTIASKKVPWNMFDAHRILENGTWYWRFRSVDNEDIAGTWSETYSFDITDDIPVFATPPFEQMAEGIPAKHPRLFAFLDEGIEKNRHLVEKSGEYYQMMDRVNTAMNTQADLEANLHRATADIRNAIVFLHPAYVVTGDRTYADKMIELTAPLLEYTDMEQIFEDDFVMGHTLVALGYTYDLCYDFMSEKQRLAYEKKILDIAWESYVNHDRTYEEIHIFDNHFWQHAERTMFQMAMLLHDKYPQAAEMLEYYYELWTTRGPASGFNRTGNWHNGTSYFNANIYTLFYMPSVLSYLTGHDFLQHPWYRNAGKALVYSWPPHSYSQGFGDGHERYPAPTWQRIALADYLGRELDDPYAQWYVNQSKSKGKNILTRDYEMRLYRIANLHRTYGNNPLPANFHKSALFKDSGEFNAHSDIEDVDNNVFLSFRSSPYGSGSHTLSDQNSFNLHYKGKPVYRSSGYYLNFSDPHNLLSYRHTRAHNTILVNGIGQPFTSKAYGEIVRSFDGENLSYCLGDASKAYFGYTDDPMWQKNFRNSNVEESPENGFGPTPLTLYKRHVVFLYPDIVVLYDELEASEPVTWDWLLHSPVKFDIGKDNTLVTYYPEGRFTATAQLFSEQVANITQTDQFLAPPDPAKVKRGEVLANQWHLTASFGKSPANRILTIIRIAPEGTTAEKITRSKEGDLIIGDWMISAETDPAKPPKLVVMNLKNKSSLNYGSDDPVIDGKLLPRKNKQSTIVTDFIDGIISTVELEDNIPQPTY